VPKTPPAAVATAGIAAVGLVARTVGGHMSASVPGAIAIAVHVLAAAVWCGTLAALFLTVHHRGQWARVLPRFSEMSLWCVIALLAGGVTGALVVVDSASQLFASGYGRVLLVKIVLTVGLAQSSPLAARGKVASRYRIWFAIKIAHRVGNHGGGVDHGRCTVGYRLGLND
jgi:putative copper resistance protein D